MDRRSRRDQGQARQEAEDRSQGCGISLETDAGRSLSSSLGTESGESGSATAAVAPASIGADAYPDHESTASAGHERRSALEIEAVERTEASRAGEVGVSSLGQQTQERV